LLEDKWEDIEESLRTRTELLKERDERIDRRAKDIRVLL